MPNLFHAPDTFAPERFLPKSHPYAQPELFSKDDQTAFQPFGLGSRGCIGRHLAYAEIRLILARLVWRFNMELDEVRLIREQGTAEWVDQKSYRFWERRPLWVWLRARKIE